MCVLLCFLFFLETVVCLKLARACPGILCRGANSLFTIAISQHRTQRFSPPQDSQSNESVVNVDIFEHLGPQVTFYRDVDLRHTDDSRARMQRWREAAVLVAAS